MSDRFAWGTGELVPDEDVSESTRLAEGAWREEDHPRGYHGRFGHGTSGEHSGGRSGGTPGRTAPRSRSSTVSTAGGPVTVARHADGSGTAQVGGTTLNLNSNEYGRFALGVGALEYTPRTPSGRKFQIGAERSIEADGQNLGLITRTGKTTFELRVRPHEGATDEQIRATPGIPITDKDAAAIHRTFAQHEQDAKKEEQAAADAARKANIAAGTVDEQDAARRASGKPPTGEGPDGRGMPDTIASADAKTKAGDVTLHREAGDDYTHLSVGDQHLALTNDEMDGMISAVRRGDDELDVGEHDTLVDSDGLTFGRVTKTAPNTVEVQIDNGRPIALTSKDADRIEQANLGLDGARRFDGDYGVVDVYPGKGGQVSIRHLGEDGQPVTTTFDSSSAEAIDRAMTVVYEGFDEFDTSPNAPDSGVTAKTVTTNKGPVEVRLDGPWGAPGSSLSVMPTQHYDWGVAVDGPQMDDFVSAWKKVALGESKRPGAGGTTVLAEAKISNTAWSTFGQADYDIGQWRKACLIAPAAASENKADYGLPVREPDGTLNRNAVHAAAGRLGQVKADPATKRAAARKLVALYGQLDEDPPQSVTDLASEVDANDGAKVDEGCAPKKKLAEARNIGAWVESRLHLALTQLGDDMYGGGRLTREERIALSSAVGEALTAFADSVQADAPQLYERDLYAEPGGDEPAEVAMSEAVRRLTEAAGVTAEELRTALYDAVKETYGGKDIYVWVRDWTDTWVVFSTESASDCELYQQNYTLAGRDVTLTGQPTEVRARTVYEPEPEGPGEPPEPSPAAPSMREAHTTVPGTAPATPKEEGRMPEITEEQARQLAEAATNKTQLDEALARLNEATAQITKLTERVDASDARTRTLENDREARQLVTEALKTSGIPAASHARLTESVCRTLPLTESGTLNTDAFTKTIESAITATRTEIASLLEEAGVGQIRGLGESRNLEPLTESDFETNLAERFQRLGMATDAAKIAATGRR